ncbi:MAG: hypothetical protein AB7N80_02090 [Bdellovibrionales bacterium]
MIKYVLFLMLLSAATQAQAIEVGGCYKLKQNKAFPNEEFYISYFCSQMAPTSTSKSFLGFALYATLNDRSQTEIFSCGAAKDVKMNKAGKATKVETGIERAFITFVENDNQSGAGRFHLLEDIKGSYTEVQGEEKAAILKRMSDGFASGHCRIRENEAEDLGDAILSRKDLQFDLSKSDLQSSDLVVNGEITCNYDVGFWPYDSSRSCGERKISLRVDDQQVLRIPEIAVFDRDGGKSIKNYEIEFKVTNRKGDNIVWISANGKDINNFNALEKPLLVTKLKGGVLGVDYEGTDFFKTELPFLDEASMHITLQTSFEDRFDEGFRIFDRIGWHSMGANNRSYTTEKDRLKNQTTFLAPDTYVVSTRPVEHMTLRYYASYESDVGSDALIQAWAQIYLPLTQKGASELPRLQLERRK